MSDFTNYVKTADSPTVYGQTSTGQNIAFENQDQFLGSGGHFSQVQISNSPIANPVNYSQWIQSRTVPVSLNPSTTTNTNALTAPPVTNSDINSLLSQNQQFQQQVVGLMQPSADETAAAQQKNQAYNTLQNFDVSVEGGIKDIMNKPIPLEFQQGQQSALTRDAAFTRSSLARSLDASVNNLQAVQQNRQQLLQAAQQQVQFGQQNIATKLQLDQVQRQEQAAALATAMDNNIQSPFFLVGGTVYSTPTGQPFTSEADFLKKTGMTLAAANAKNLIQTVSNDPLLTPAQAKSLGVPYGTTQSQAFGITAPSGRSGGGSSGGGSGSGSGTTPEDQGFHFTASQLNKGALNSKMTVNDFKRLPGVDQNFYINGYSQVDKFKKVIAEEIASQGRDAIGALRDEIDNSNLPQQVKEELKNYVEQTAPSAPAPSNKQWWQFWK